MSGRSAFRAAITSRLVPSLRAFNPELILLSSGFDAVVDDVGNSRSQGRGMVCGMDLLPEDYFWVTKEIQKVSIQNRPPLSLSWPRSPRVSLSALGDGLLPICCQSNCRPQIADMCCGGRVVSVLEGGYGCLLFNPSKPGSFGVRAATRSADGQRGAKPYSSSLNSSLNRVSSVHHGM